MINMILQNLEMRYLKHLLRVRVQNRGFQILRTLWIRTPLFSNVGVATTIVPLQVCSTSTSNMDIAAASTVSVRSA